MRRLAYLVLSTLLKPCRVALCSMKSPEGLEPTVHGLKMYHIEHLFYIDTNDVGLGGAFSQALR